MYWLITDIQQVTIKCRENVLKMVSNEIIWRHNKKGGKYVEDSPPW